MADERQCHFKNFETSVNMHICKQGMQSYGNHTRGDQTCLYNNKGICTQDVPQEKDKI